MTTRGAFTITSGIAANVEYYPANAGNPTYYVFKNVEVGGVSDSVYVVTVAQSITLSYIAIGGGGAGGAGGTTNGSGGDAGEFVQSFTYFEPGTEYTITIGGGGPSTLGDGSNGFPTSMTKPGGGTKLGSIGITNIITAAGGTYGSANGGSGGLGRKVPYVPPTNPADGGDGRSISLFIPSITTKYAGGGGAGGGLGGDIGTSGGDGGVSLATGQDGQTEGSGGGGGGSDGVDGGTAGKGKFGILYFFVSPIGSVCFLEGTPVETDQGEVAIDKLDTKVNTINGKRIVAVTKTPGEKDCLLLIKKDLLGENMPNKDTIITRWHEVLYEGEMEETQRIPGVTLYPYNGETLYNVLLDKHETMKINGLTVETLDPKHKIAMFYKSLAFHY